MTFYGHFESFITTKIIKGRFESKSEAVRAGMRLLEEREQKVDALRLAITEGSTIGESNHPPPFLWTDPAIVSINK